MAKAYGILVDDTCDLIIENGDLKIGESDQQHVQFIFKARYGQFRQFPLVGVGIESYIKGSINAQALKREIKVQLEADNYRVNEISVGLDSSGELEISVDAFRLR